MKLRQNPVVISKDSNFNISVVTLTGKTLSIDIDYSTTVEDLKYLI